MIGKVRQHHTELPSTNAFLADLLTRQTVVEGTLVRADHQTQGRGQQSNSWFASPRKNLLFSFVLRPIFLEVREAFGLNLFTSLAIKATLDGYHFGQPIRVKWPNDIYCGRRKIAGILIQNSLRGSSLSCSVIGIGLNVNEQDFPTDLAATSMHQERGHSYDLGEVFERLLQHLNTFYAELPDEAPRLLTAYQAALYQLDEWRPYRLAERTINGRIDGVDASGHLLMTESNGDGHRLAHGQVSFLR